MKYGLELQQNIFAPWRLSYVSYDVLKEELKSRQLDHGWHDKDEKEFIILMDNELSKVYDFINAKLTEIDARILYCERTIQTLQKNPTMASDANYSIMDEALTEILFDVNDLSRFTRVNFTAIQKLLKKHDKWTGLQLKQAYVAKLREKPLDKQRFDVAIIYISALHDICRNRGHQSVGNPTAGAEQNAFERATAKYWIHPDNITEVKAIIMLHLPVLIFDKNKKWEPSDSAISSVYFDNDNFDLYTSRLQRDEGAEAIRYRWYGKTSSRDVYIERKTHHAPWLNGTSVKDRFRLDESQVNAFTVGRHSAEQIAQDLRNKNADSKVVDDIQFIAQGVQVSMKERRLEPIVRVFYNRTAFQLPDDQRLRISLDTDLTYVREDHLDGQMRRQPTYNWRRTDVGIDFPFAYVKDADILRFPYAVLETKLQTHLGQEPPQWLTSLVESHLVHEVPRFSKYLHGACHFYRSRLPLLPWWLAELNVDIRKPRAENIGLTRSRSFKPLIDGRYRRAMIEEQERAHQHAVVNAANALGRTSGSNSRQSSNHTLGSRHSIQSQHHQPVPPSKDYLKNPQLAHLSASSSPSPTSSAHQSASPPPPTRSSGTKSPGSASYSSQLRESYEDPGIMLSPPKKDYTLVRMPSSSSPSNATARGASPASNQLPTSGSSRASSPFSQNQQQHLRDTQQRIGQFFNKMQHGLASSHEKLAASVRAASPMHMMNQENSAHQQQNNQDGRISTTPKSHSLVGMPVEEDTSPKRQKVKVRVEPKTFFANERTFISWLQFCALLLSVALSLLNFGDHVSRVVGGVFMALAGFIAIYALYRFEKRAWMIHRRIDGRYDDVWGPVILCVLLVIALIINFYLRFK